MNGFKKIGIFLNNDPSWGGQYQYTLNVLGALSYYSQHNEVEIVGIYTFEFWSKIIENYGISGVYLTQKGANVVKTIHKLDCDMIISTSEGMMLNEYVPDIPFVSVIHDLMYYYNREKYEINEIDREIRRRMYYKICANSEGIIVDSNTGKKQVVELFGKSCEDNIFVQPFTISEELLNAKSVSDSELSFLERIPEKYLYYPAAIRKEKNHRRLIEAVANLRRCGMDVNVVLTGNPGDDYDYVMSMIREKNVSDLFTYLDFVSDEKISYLYKHARAMVFPTMSGPTNIPPIEAMAFGCPMAVSDVGEMSVQVGNAGILFDPFSVEDICDAINRLWMDDELCKHLKSECQKRFSAYFSIDRFNENYSCIVDECLERIDKREKRLRNLVAFLENKRTICYGAGQNAWVLSEFLNAKGIEVDLYIDNRLKCQEYMGRPVFQYKHFLEIDNMPKSVTAIVVSVPEDAANKIEKELYMDGYKNVLVVDKQLAWELFCREKKYPSFL